MRHAGRVAAVSIAALVLLAGAVELLAVRERLYPPSPADEATLYLRSGPALRRLTIAYNALAADVYWIRAIQFYGGAKRRLEANLLAAPPPPPMLAAPPDDYELLYPLLDITTTLDPRFNIAYRFGAVFLAEPYPGGSGRPDLAIALLEKGLRERPDKWEYLEDIGFVHYWYTHDYLAASEWFQKAADVPGAPWWLRSLAATTRAKGGDRESSRLMWEAIRQTTEVEYLRNDAERRLAQLRALDDIDALQRAVDAAKARSADLPLDWAALVRARVLRTVPADPSGVPYELSSEGRVTLARSSPLLPLPVEPPAR